jgi:predicted MFS family arabinose efflux permease
LSLLLASWALIAFLSHSISLLLMGVFLLDLAVQAVHVSNLSVVVSLNPQQSGRLIGGYMVFYSVGSAVGAITATAIYARYGWPGICVLGGAFSAIALLVWIASRFFDRRSNDWLGRMSPRLTAQGGPRSSASRQEPT